MANVGTLTVELGASTAKFQQDLGKAVSIAEGNAKRIDTAFNSVKRTFQTLFAGLTIHAFVGMIEGSIDAADKLHDLAQSTGLTVETLAGLEFAAKQSGTDLEGVAKAVGKLNIQIAQGRGGNQESIATFKALGISVADLQRLSENDILLKVADDFQKWEDGANKSGIASRAFGKSYQSIIPLLNEGSAALKESIAFVQKWGGVTTETGNRANEFNDTLVKVNLIISSFSRNLASALLTPLQSLANAFIENTEGSTKFTSAAQLTANALVTIAENAVSAATGFRLLGESVALTSAVLNVKIGEGAIDRIEQIWGIFRKRTDDILATEKKLRNALNNPNAPTFGDTPKPKGKPPGIPDQSISDALNKQLDNQLRALERQSAAERDVLRDRLAFLDQFHQDGLTSIRDFYATRRQVEDEALRAEQQNIDAEIALIQKRLKADLKPAEREGFEGRIADAIARRSKIEQDANVRGAKSFIEEDRAVKAFKDSVEELGISLAELNGDAVSAALSRFDFANRKLKEQLEIERDTGTAELSRLARIGLVKLGQKREEVAIQAQLTAQQQTFSNILEDVGLEQQRIGIQVTSGLIGETEGLVKLSALNRSRISQLQAVAEAFRNAAAAAAEMGNIAGQEKALLEAKRMEVQIEQLQAQTDLLGDKFRVAFHDSFADALSSAIDGTKSLKDALKDLERSIVQMVSRVAANNIADALFGKGTTGGNLSSIFGNLFGSAGSGLASLFSGGAGVPLFATGTNFAPGGLALVGERGPEVVNLPRGSQVIPNDIMGGRRQIRSHSVTVNVNVLPGATRASADQAAAAMGLEVRRAMARNT